METRMKYMLLVYFDEQALGEAEREQCYGESAQLAQELNSSGQYLGANPLHPTATATSVRMRTSKRLVTDGPFAETREQFGGYFLIDAKNLDEAIGIAARIPMVSRALSRFGQWWRFRACPASGIFDRQINIRYVIACSGSDKTT
jgi:hypothetical protein